MMKTSLNAINFILSENKLNLNELDEIVYEKPFIKFETLKLSKPRDLVFSLNYY